MSSAPQSDDADLSRQNPREQLVDGLRRQLGRWEASDAAEDAALFSCGAPAVDRLLPGGGLRHGMLIEWLAGHVAASGAVAVSTRPPVSTFHSGAATLGLLGAREACREGGALVVIDRRQTFYPPAAAAWGIDLDRLIVVHPQNARDELWAAVQALRSPAVAAMFSAIDRLDSRAFRRLQLAAQAGRTLGVLVRPASTREQPSWADVRLEVGTGGWGLGTETGDDERLGIRDERWRRAKVSHPSSLIPHLSSCRRVQVQIMRCNTGRAGGSAMLEIDDATYTVREAEEGHGLSAIGYRPGLLADSR
jgi:protein ImuA